MDVHMRDVRKRVVPCLQHISPFQSILHFRGRRPIPRLPELLGINRDWGESRLGKFATGLIRDRAKSRQG